MRRLVSRVLVSAALLVASATLAGCAVVSPRVHVRVWMPGYWAHPHVWVGGHWRYR